MPCHVRKISGPAQSGKTTMVLGYLERLHRQGITTAFVLPSEMLAELWRRRTSVPCYGADNFRLRDLPAGISAVAIDDFDYSSIRLEDVSEVQEWLNMRVKWLSTIILVVTDK